MVGPFSGAEERGVLVDFFWEGGWISNKRYASRGRRKRVHGSLGGGSVDCVDLCFFYWDLFPWRRASSTDS